MAEINLSGIDRSNSNENTVAETASLIVNARKKGSTWEYIGDKIGEGINSLGRVYPHGYFWHYKIKGYYDRNLDDGIFHESEMLIAVNDFEQNGVKQNKNIDILLFQAKGGVGMVDHFRDSSGYNCFEFETDEEYLNLHSLNDIVILDTDKNKYYFVWDEEKYTFVQLPEIKDFEISVNYDKIKYDASVLFATNKFNTSDTLYIDVDTDTEGIYGGVHIYSIKDTRRYNNVFIKLYKWFYNVLKSDINSIGHVLKEFRIVAAIELIDGTILKTSNIIDFIDNLYDTKDLENTINARNCQFFYFNTERESKTNPNEGLTIAHLKNTGVTFGKSDNMNLDKNIHSYIYSYNNVKINFDKKLYNILKTWIDANIIHSVSVYVTEPDNFLDYNRIRIENSIFQAGYLDYGSSYFLTYIPYNNEKAYSNDVPYYKIGEFKIRKLENFFEIKPNLIGNIVSKKQLTVAQDLSKKYVSKTNTVYNGMIHKCNVRNIINIKDLIKGYNPNVKTGITGSGSRKYKHGCIYVDFKIKQKWYRYRLDSSKSLVSHGVLNGDWSHVYTIVNPRIEFSTMDIKEVNLIISDHNENLKIFKKLDLKMSSFTNSLVVFPIIDFNNDDVYFFSPDKSIMENKVIAIDTYMEFNFYDCPLYFNVLRSVLNSLKSPTYTIEQNLDAIYYEDANRLQLSATENPFIYPSERSYRFGDANNKVIGCDSAVVGTSDAKFGMLPLHVFTKNGLWMMETAQGDIAYISQHLIENINCFDNHKLIHRVLGGVVFGAIDGIYFVSGNKIQKISNKLEGRVVLQDIDGIFRRLNNVLPNAVITTDDPANVYIHNISKKIDNIMQNYFTDKSFCIHDKIENELLFIEPTRRGIFVLQLNDMSWTMRSDVLFNSDFGYGTTGDWGSFNDYFEMDNKYILVKNETLTNPIRIRHHFYNLRETTASKLGTKNINNNIVLFASGVIMMNQYMKIEHIIARFNKITNTEFDSHIFLIGSRDGIEWKVLNHSFGKITKNMSGQEMRRCFTSARYFQFVYVRLERGKQNTAPRKDSYFERFTFDMSNSDAEGKIR
jgi:hypothetical protein